MQGEGRQPASVTLAVTVSTALAPTRHASAPHRSRLPDWWGWVVVGLIALVALLTWLPAADLPLGDSNEGRILARLAIQARNFWELGPVESAWGSSMIPFHFGGNYAHHPPLTNFAQIAVAGALGQDEWQIRLFGYLNGLATLVLIPVLLRTLRVGWSATLLATGALAVTPMFWMYGRVGGGFALIAGLAALVVYLRRTPAPSGWMIVLGALVTAATVMLSWVAAATAALFWVWLVWARRLDRVSIALAGGGLAGAAITAAWILGATDLGELTSHAATRAGGQFTFGEFLASQGEHALLLLPVWFLVLVIPALAAGLVDHRTRAIVAVTTLVAAVWTFAPQEGAMTHNFWNLNWLLPVTVGIAALVDAVLTRVPSRWAAGLAVALGLGLVLALVGTVRGPTLRREVGAGAEAGALLVEHSPFRPGRALQLGLAGPRWVSWYWDRPVREATAGILEEAPARTMVVLRLDRLPPSSPLKRPSRRPSQ